MKPALVALLICICIPVLSQSTGDLDDRYGIKDFVLSAPYSQYKSKLELIGHNGKSSYYKYISENQETLFDFPVDNITLQFYSDRLYKVILTFFWGKTDNSKLVSNLVDLFGAETENVSEKLPGGQEQNSLIWHGNDVRLALVYDGTTTRLTMYSKSIHREILKDDF